MVEEEEEEEERLYLRSKSKKAFASESGEDTCPELSLSTTSSLYISFIDIDIPR
jgi:hypothetical protein